MDNCCEISYRDDFIQNNDCSDTCSTQKKDNNGNNITIRVEHVERPKPMFSDIEPPKKWIEAKREMNYNNSNNSEESNMSIVGIIECQDGVLGFGDTKGTLLGKYHDIERGTIRKIFITNDFMIATYGNNKVGTENIEDLIEKEINDRFSNDRKTIMENLKNKIIDNSDLDYNFIFYDKNQRQLFKHKIINKEPTVSREYGHSFGGADDYIKLFNILFNHNFNYKKESGGRIRLMTVAETKEKINDILTYFIKTLDDTIEYNPVGLPLIFEELYF